MKTQNSLGNFASHEGKKVVCCDYSCLNEMVGVLMLNYLVLN